MIAVIFEVWPEQSRRQDYFEIAAELRPLLAQIDGFISLERFESLSEPGKVLSLSFWRDEAAVAQWRQLAEHRDAQAKGGPDGPVAQRGTHGDVQHHGRHHDVAHRVGDGDGESGRALGGLLDHPAQHEHPHDEQQERRAAQCARLPFP